MFLSILFAHAAPIDIVLDGTITAGEIDGIDVAGPARFRVTMDDTTVANGSGVFSIPGTPLVVEIDDASYLMDASGADLASIMSGFGFVNVQGTGLVVVLGETYVSEPAVDFSNTTLSPFGAHALIDNGGALIAAGVSFDGATSAVTTQLDVSLWRMRVEYPGFIEETIEANYGADVIDPSFAVSRRPETLEANLDSLDGALPDCFIDRGDVFAGAYVSPNLTGVSTLGSTVALAFSGGSLSGTVDGLAATGVHTSTKAVVSTSAGLYAAFFKRVTGKKGFWYGVPAVDCAPADLETWYGSSLSGL